jgi:hypothetical protein
MKGNSAREKKKKKRKSVSLDVETPKESGTCIKTGERRCEMKCIREMVRP